MEYSSPLLKGIHSPRFISFGKIMLRLTPPNYGKIRVANTFEASCGGSEAIRNLMNMNYDIKR